MNKPFPLYYETYGDAQHPCVILISGLGGQLIGWPKEFIEGLVKNQLYVIAFDNRDMGLSAYYDHLETPHLAAAIRAKQLGEAFLPPYSLRDMAMDVVALMDNVQVSKAHLVGISMGGMIAQLVALLDADRVMSLTCIASTSGDPTLPPAKPEILQYFFSPQRTEEDLSAFVENRLHMYRLYNHPDHLDEAAAREYCLAAYHRAHHPEGYIRQLLATMFAEPRKEKLRAVRVPSLIIHGDHDPIFPIEHGKQLAEVLPNSRLEVMEKMGHAMPPCLCDEIVGKMVRHIKEEQA